MIYQAHIACLIYLPGMRTCPMQVTNVIIVSHPCEILIICSYWGNPMSAFSIITGIMSEICCIVLYGILIIQSYDFFSLIICSYWGNPMSAFSIITDIMSEICCIVLYGILIIQSYDFFSVMSLNNQFNKHGNGQWHQGPLLSIWINFDPSLDEKSHGQ